MRSEQVAQQGEAVRVLQEELTTVKKVVLTMHAGILHAQQLHPKRQSACSFLSQRRLRPQSSRSSSCSTEQESHDGTLPFP